MPEVSLKNAVIDCAPEIKCVQDYPDLETMVHATQYVLQDLVRYIENFRRGQTVVVIFCKSEPVAL